MSRIPVAICDRSESFLHAFVYVLQQQAYSSHLEVVAATTDIDLLFAHSTTPPKVVLLGLSVPSLVDPQIVQSIRSRWPEVSIVVLSWLELEEYRAQAIAANVDGVLAKTALYSELLPLLLKLATS